MFVTGVLIAVIVFTIVLYFIQKNHVDDKIVERKYDMRMLITEINEELAADTTEDVAYIDDASWEDEVRRKEVLRNAARDSIYGVDSAKLIIKNYINQYIKEVLLTEEDLNGVVDFLNPTDYVKWETLLYYAKDLDSPNKPKKGKDAFNYLAKKYDFAKSRYDGKRKLPYHLTSDDLESVYTQELSDYKLTYLDKVNIITNIVFSKYKGFGIIDTIREQNVDGVLMGTSGSTLFEIMDLPEDILKLTQSVWVFWSGKYIHLSFLDFGTEDEMRRVITLILAYAENGVLDRKRGYMVASMYDTSRVLATRKPITDSWACFIRKFNISFRTPEELYLPKDDKINSQLPVNLIKWIMRTRTNVGFTGRQGSGKTTAMVTFLYEVDPTLTMRTLEMTPEMWLRERMPNRNILSFSETQYVSADALQDATKKSDAAILVVGEVATDKVASNMIQAGMTASEFTVFSHHANTPEDLVLTLRNSLVKAGDMSNEKIAEAQVAKVVRCNVHLAMDVNGVRRFSKIHEIVPVPEGRLYPKIDRNDIEYSMAKITREYYKRSTDQSIFVTHEIMRFNEVTQKYEALDWFSADTTARMMSKLTQDQREEFIQFIEENWGKVV